jgi:hypothetical protein
MAERFGGNAGPVGDIEHSSGVALAGRKNRVLLLAEHDGMKPYSVRTIPQFSRSSPALWLVSARVRYNQRQLFRQSEASVLGAFDATIFQSMSGLFHELATRALRRWLQRPAHA